MHNAVRVQFADRLAQLTHHRDRNVQRHSATFRHHGFKRFAGHVIVDHHKAIRQLVGGFDARQTWAGTFTERRPDIAASKLKRDFLAYERPGSPDADQFGDASGAAGEHLVDMVGVIKAHGVHDLFVIHYFPDLPTFHAPTDVFDTRRNHSQ